MVQLGARWYDPDLGRFVQPDTIIPQPGNPQTFNRYSYVNNRPVNLVDPSGHEAECQSWDTTCWEDRYYNAHGLCRNGNGDYKRQCAVEFKDKDILEEVLGERGGLAIVEKADPIEVIKLLLTTAWKYRPNMLIVGVGVSGDLGRVYGGISGAWVFDFKHNQMDFFVSPAGGVGAGLGFGVGYQVGVAWCGSGCFDVDDFRDSFLGGGGSLVSPYGMGGGVDFQWSTDKQGNWHQEVVTSLVFEAILGTLGAELHGPVISNSIPGSNRPEWGLKSSFGDNDWAMAQATFSRVYQATQNAALAGLYASYAFVVDYDSTTRPK